jgi:hypothetical protein
LRTSVVLTFSILCLNTELNKQVFSVDASRWTYNSLPVNFRNLWKAMLNFLHQNRVIPLLVEKLINVSGSENESSHRRKMAAVWVKELLKSVDKNKRIVELVQKWEREGYGSKEREGYGSKERKKHKVLKTVKLRLQAKLKTKCTASHFHKQIVQEVEKQNPHLKKVMSLRIKKLPRRFTKLQFLCDTLLKPSGSTNIFLPRYVVHYSACVLPLLLLVNNRVHFFPFSDPLRLQTEFHETTLTKFHTIQIEPTHIWCQLSCSMIYRHVLFVHICSCN